MELSVIIPTYNRKNTLSKCVSALLNQAFPKTEYEIIIVDDGSTDGTKEMVKDAENLASAQLHSFQQEHKGPAAARNRGIKNAKGKILLFIGDDIIGAPELLAEHMNWHGKYPDENVAVLGYVTWSPEIKITPFMSWLENGGPQFKYWAIKDKQNVFWGHLYSSNISLKKDFLSKNGFFDEDFPYACYEDTELGLRLSRKGLKMVFNSQAKGYHLHYTNLDTFLEKMGKIEKSVRIYRQKIENNRQQRNNAVENFIFDVIFSSAIFRLLLLCGHFFENKVIVPWLYSYLMEAKRFQLRNER